MIFLTFWDFLHSPTATGISFSSQERNIAIWQGELLDEDGTLIRQLAPAAKQ